MIPPVKREAAQMPTLALAPLAAAATAPVTNLQPQLPAEQPEERPAKGDAAEGASGANASLEVTKQPPEMWYKDQYGRKATFELRVHRTSHFCARCVDQRNLTVHLLYESGKLVEKQSVMHVAAGLCLNKDNESAIAIRITEVSKNHQNQRFRLRVVVPPCPMGCAPVNFVVSDPVLVLSKKNKRPVKSDNDGESPAKIMRTKKSKCSATASPSTPIRLLGGVEDSPKLPTSDSASVSAAIAGFACAMPSEATHSIAPFTPTTPNLCLWANAAYDLLHKLQWQCAPSDAPNSGEGNLDSILAQASAKAFRCPSCLEAYGELPSHREDCDLKLLLEQGELSDASANADQETNNNAMERHTPQKAQGRQDCDWSTTPATPMVYTGCVTPKRQPSSYDMTQELPQKPEAMNAQLPSAAPFGGAVTPEELTKSINLSSWDGYSVLSRIMFSSELGGKALPEGVGASMSLTPKKSGPLPPVETLSPDFSAFPSAMMSFGNTSTAMASKTASQRFSRLLSSTKNLSAEAAGLLRESDAELAGDTSLLSSLSRVSLSEFMGSDNAKPTAASSFSGLISGDQPVLDNSTEGSVDCIAACDFRHCGYPAFDASSRHLGFYFLLGATPQAPAELRFVPSLYALPPEMLQELEHSVVEWRKIPGVVRTRAPGPNEKESLEQLKRSVMQHLENSR